VARPHGSLLARHVKYLFHKGFDGIELPPDDRLRAR
jgi:hypothetical protein